MLVLNRKSSEGLYIDGVGTVHIKVLSIGTDKVRLGIDAPPSVLVLRDEVLERCVERGEAIRRDGWTPKGHGWPTGKIGDGGAQGGALGK